MWRLLQDTGQQGNDNIDNANGSLITIMSELPDGAGDLLHLQVAARDLHHQQLPAPSFAVDLFWLLFTVFTIITYYWSTYFRVSQNYVCLHRVLINWRLVTSGAPYLAGSDCQCEPDPVVH